MTCRRWLLALFGLALAAADSQAQMVFYSGTCGYGVAGFRVGRARGPLSVSVGFGRCYPPPLCLTRQVMVLYPSPVVVLPQPRTFLDAVMQAAAAQPPPEALPEPAPLPEPPLAGGAPAGNFRPLDPGNRARAQQPLPPPPPKAPPPPKPEEPQPKPQPPPKPREPGELPRPPLPEDDPTMENERLVELGRAAFAAGEYGRAAERFRHATAIAPRQPLAHFLLAQALFALGKYHTAADALQAGLTLAPDWPGSPFRPLELYGPNVADYSEHLHRLAEVLRTHAEDPDLLFLYACQLWFDGRKEEARVLFERARRQGADAGAIDRFLRALPAEPVV